jgi:hypothetical protein
MFFVILTLFLFVAVVCDFRHARIFWTIGRMPDTRKALDRATKLFIILLVVFMAWSQDKDSLNSSGNGDWLSGATLESLESGRYSLLEGGGSTEDASGITWALLSGLPPFTSNAVLTASQFTGGFACVGITNIQPSALDAPAQAVAYTNWPYAVARQSVLLPQGCLPEGFTFGGRSVTNLYVSASGMISFDSPKSSPVPATNGIPDGTAANYIAVLQTPSDIVPTNGVFWYALGTNSSIFTWKDVFLGQDTNCLATVQAELYTNGNFTCRYYFPSPTNNYAQLTNSFLVGAQNHSGGETVLHTNALLAIHPSFLPAFELQWKAFGDLLTGALAENDFDADGLSDLDELRLVTNPRNPDSDGDALMDGEEISLYGTDPNAFSSDASGQGDLWKLLNGLAPSNAPYTTAMPSESVGILTVTTRLANALADGGAVLRIGNQYIPVLAGTTLVSRIAIPRDATIVFILARGVNCDNAIAHITIEASSFTKIRDLSGALSGSFTLSPTCMNASGTLLMPSYTITPSVVCFHSPTSSVLRIESADPDIYFNTGQGLVREYTPPMPESLPPGFTIGAITGNLACAGSVYTMTAVQFTKAAHFCNSGGPGGWEDPYNPEHREDWHCHTGMDGHVVEDPHTESDCPCIILIENAYDCYCSGSGLLPCSCSHPVSEPHATPADEPHDGPPYKQTREHATLEICKDTVFFPVTVPQGEYEPCPRCKCALNVPLSAYVWRQTGNINVAPLSLYTNGSFAVTGIRPSTNFAAEVLTIHLKDTYIQQSYTVLGTSVYPADTGHSVSNWFIGCNVTNALTLWTGVKLPSDTGEVTLSVTVESGTPAPQLYVYNCVAQSNELLVTQGQLTYTQNLGDWRSTYCDTNGYTQAYLLCASGGVGRVTHSYETYSGQPYDVSASSNQLFTVMSASLCSVMLDESGRLILGTNGKAVPDVEIGWEDVEACTYNPLAERGTPQMENVSALLGGIPEWVTFVETQGGAELTITKSEFEGFKTWALEYAGMTNGMPYYTWADGTNSYVRVTVTNTSVTVNTTNGTMGIWNLNLTIQDESFNLSTNEINVTVGVYRDIENTSEYFSNYTLAAPREDVGLPPFSQSNALVVRFNPMGMTGNFVCMATDEDDNETEIPLTLQPDGTYVSALIVPISDLDDNTDLGLESSVSVVRLKLASGTRGWDRTIIDIKELGTPAKNILKGRINIRHALLLSALVTNEEKASARYDKAVVEAGENVVGLLHYGVTPLFSPDTGTINTNLLRHRVWIHSGHGCNEKGIMIVGKTGLQYRIAYLKAADISRSNLDYDLVFMNTCLSTDVYYRPIIEPFSRALIGWETNAVTLTSHAVKDIGTKLNAKNYVGWDTEVYREVSSDVAVWLTEKLDTKANGELQTVEKAITATKLKMQDQIGNHRMYVDKLRLVSRDDSVILDINKRAN